LVCGATKAIARIKLISCSTHLIALAFSSFLSWEYYGGKCFEYLLGDKWIHLYRYLWGLFVFVGSMVKLEIVWNFSDAMNALMAIPNLIGLVLLSGVLLRETKTFDMGIRDGSIDKFD
jgi:alanine or glycine:cation symporter, AGCS family